jgi:hypothetical protein
MDTATDISPEIADEEIDQWDFLSVLWGDAWEGDEDLRIESEERCPTK